MRITILFITSILMTMVSHQSFSQMTQIEFSSGINNTNFTLFSVKPLDKNRKFSLSTLAFFHKYHHKKDVMFDAVGVLSTVYWNVSKSISIGPTLYYNSAVGLTKRITLLHTKREGKFTYAMAPAIVHSNKTKDLSAELFIQMQYMQPLKNDWSLVSYIKLLNGWKGINKHDRSYQYLRIGLSKNNNQFGLAFSFDEYGTHPVLKKSIGFFIRKKIIEK